MKICAVVVWFNPEKLKNPVENIKTYSKFVEKVYIVDNSENNNSSLVAKIRNAEYIPLYKNTGIAHALNVGCNAAIKGGFELCLTMDQDSFWNEDEIKKYFSVIETEKDGYENFSPTIRRELFPSVLGDIKRKILHRKSFKFSDNFQHPDRFITSGSVMKLSALKIAGGGQAFNEHFFIDEVDHEYCARFSKSGFKNKCCNAILNHQLGEKKKSFFPHMDFHSDFRIYYIIRNMMIMMKNYPEYTKKYNYKTILRTRIIQRVLFCNSIKESFLGIKLVIRAIKDSKQFYQN